MINTKKTQKSGKVGGGEREKGRGKGGGGTNPGILGNIGLKFPDTAKYDSNFPDLGKHDHDFPDPGVI